MLRPNTTAAVAARGNNNKSAGRYLAVLRTLASCAVLIFLCAPSVFADTGPVWNGNASNLASIVRAVLGVAAGLQANQDTYGRAMEQAFDTQLASTVNAVNTGAGVAAGGASRGAQVSVGGINQAYSLELKSNKVVYESTVGAAQISRDAGVEVANLRALNHVVTGFFRDVARRIDSGLKPSY